MKIILMITKRWFMELPFCNHYPTGAWSKKGFEVLELVLTKYQILQSNISTLRDEI